MTVYNSSSTEAQLQNLKHFMELTSPRGCNREALEGINLAVLDLVRDGTLEARTEGREVVLSVL